MLKLEAVHSFAELETSLKHWLATWISEPFQVARMAGGISPRKFFRVTWDAHPPGIAMFFPAPLRLEPFLEVQALLHAHGVRVPALYAKSAELGWLLVEDLGTTLAEVLETFPEARRALYERAVKDLASAQMRLQLPPDSIVRSRAFDEPLLLQELEHFRQYALQAQGVNLTEHDALRFTTQARALAGKISRFARGFVHRDYQSRNLMVLGAPSAGFAVAWIDFQDALLGPQVYDLVALLCDSYQPFHAEVVLEQLHVFATTRQIPASERAALVQEFCYVVIQRKLKDAGRFIFMDRERGDVSYLKYVAPSLACVAWALTQLASDRELDVFRELVAKVPLPAVSGAAQLRA